MPDSAPASTTTVPPPIPRAARSLPGYGLTLDLDAVFTGEVAPVKVSFGYVLALGVVALVMMLLVAVYVGMIAAIVGVVGMQAYTSISTAKPGNLVFAYLLNAIPVALGLTVVFFLVKPLFAPPGRYAKPEPISRNDEPLLYDYVEKLCQRLGAPVPRDIVAVCDLNAAAGFRHGMLSMFWSDHRLLIGMPLVAGLDLRQFTGVLAHELGHCSQRFAMRCHYVVQTVNHWLARVAYERDVWDLWLLVYAKYGETTARLAANVALGCIWLCRLPLKALCHVGAVVSTALLRQMEYDADKYQARVSGSESVAGLQRRLHDLGQAMSDANGEFQARKEMLRVPDNLPVLYAAATSRMPVEQLDKSWALHEGERTGMFATHPAARERIKAAREMAEPGVIAVEAPARVLFKDFDGVCRKVTYLLIRSIVGEKVQDLTFAPVKEFLAAHEETDRSLAALQAIVGPEILKTFSIRPMFLRLDKLDVPADPAALPELWKRAREAMQTHRAAAEGAAGTMRAADDAIDRAVQAESLRRAGLKFEPARYGLAKGTIREAEDARLQALNTRAGAEHGLEPFEKAYRQRLAGALQLLAVKGIEARIKDAAVLKKEVNRLLAASAAMRESFGTMYELSRRVLAAQAIFSGAKKDSPLVTAELDRLTRDMAQAIRRAHADLGVAEYPFEHSMEGISIAQVILPQLPKEESGPPVLAAGAALRDGYMTLTRRVLARLAEITVQVEGMVKTARGG